MSLKVTIDIDTVQRAGYADRLDRLAIDIGRLANALRAPDNDIEAVLAYIGVAVTMDVLDELRDVFLKALLAAKAAKTTKHKVPDDLSTLTEPVKEDNA